MPVTVSQLAIAPVKGMRLQNVSEIELAGKRVVGDREFLVIDDAGGLLLTSKNPDLVQIAPTWDCEQNVLTLRFPDGHAARHSPEAGAPVTTRMYDGREISGRIITGPLSDALSGYLRQPVRLIKRTPGELGHDDEPVTLMSEASVQALAPQLDNTTPDPRRFRMNVTITGTDAWAEHAWRGQQVTIGEAAVLRVLAPVPRCVVTTRNPESGTTDARVLHALSRLRGSKDLTFGVWCDIASPGLIRMGDRVLTAASYKPAAS